MITICQRCKQAMNVEGFKEGYIAMHEDCAYDAHLNRIREFKITLSRIKNAKLMKANRERKEKQHAEQAKAKAI